MFKKQSRTASLEKMRKFIYLFIYFILQNLLFFKIFHRLILIMMLSNKLPPCNQIVKTETHCLSLTDWNNEEQVVQKLCYLYDPFSCLFFHFMSCCHVCITCDL